MVKFLLAYTGKYEFGMKIGYYCDSRKSQTPNNFSSQPHQQKFPRPSEEPESPSPNPQLHVGTRGVSHPHFLQKVKEQTGCQEVRRRDQGHKREHQAVRA